MKVVSLPAVEIDGRAVQPELFLSEEGTSLKVYSHANPSFVILRLLNRSVSVGAALLRDAVRDVIVP